MWLQALSPRKIVRVAAASALAESASSFEIESSPIDDIVKYLTSLGEDITAPPLVLKWSARLGEGMDRWCDRTHCQEAVDHFD